MKNTPFTGRQRACTGQDRDRARADVNDEPELQRDEEPRRGSMEQVLEDPKPPLTLCYT